MARKEGNVKTTYTVNTKGDNRQRAFKFDYHSYYADEVTAIEIPAESAEEAREIAEVVVGKHNVYYVFV